MQKKKNPVAVNVDIKMKQRTLVVSSMESESSSSVPRQGVRRITLFFFKCSPP